ncbi:Crp/Fnr family transcriptional regulator [Oscillatoria sp. HE19RPO]|uniref:Crp/Fnr family transcriptional regulator n=1 Tax=Oscillatoria sp. HE19RPO TaxID=2954806 RepID=UPI0020C3932B|nr:Crp/Fnr family transcriptional regulator [Oscillatoria sp. HE19RPO]
MSTNTSVASPLRLMDSQLSLPSLTRTIALSERFKSKEILPLKPDIIWKIETGVVRSMTWNEEGKVITLGFWGEGDIVGKPLSQMNPYQLECLTPVEVSQIGPHLYLQQALLGQAWKSEKFLSIIHQLSVTDRFLSLLEWLSAEFGHPLGNNQGTLINLRMTHQDFADTIGSSRVTITRLLSNFEQAGIIERFCSGHQHKLSNLCHLLCRQSLIFKG